MKRSKNGQFEKGSGLRDLSKQRFGRLEVVRFAEMRNKKSFWLCKCDCGNTKVVRSDALISLKTISCGCLKKEQDLFNLNLVSKSNHRMTKHGAYQSWAHMMTRCYKENCKYYDDYGGRGISVCSEWKDAEAFCKWADENGFQDGLTIERKNVNDNYCPENCCWIKREMQNRNKRNTLRIIYNGEKIALVEVAELLNLNYKMVRSRWYRGIRDNERLLYDGDLRDLRRRQ